MCGGGRIQKLFHPPYVKILPIIPSFVNLLYLKMCTLVLVQGWQSLDNHHQRHGGFMRTVMRKNKSSDNLSSDNFLSDNSTV